MLVRIQPRQPKERMGLQLYGNLLAKIDGKMLKEQCAITLVQAFDSPDLITIKSVVPTVGFEFNAHQRIGKKIHVSLHITTGRLVGDALEAGEALIAYEARIIAAELCGSVNVTVCSSFTCEAIPRPETP